MPLSINEKIHVLLNSPFDVLLGAARGLLCKIKVPKQVVELRKATRNAPLFLQIETTNACNAACIFCAYPHMKRKKGVMSLALFEKTVKDYAAMGGGPVCLTPVVGDALLDPHLLKRLEILQERHEINQVTLTTNGIALERYSDEEIRRMLEALYCLQFSVGGLDATTYRAMYGVDRYTQVKAAMERILKLRETVGNPAHITFAFRTHDRKFEVRHKQQLDAWRKQGVHISHIWTYANYSGLIKEDGERNLVVLGSAGEKRDKCISPSMNMTVCWDGSITACGCADFDGDKLKIGYAEKDSLAEVWSGKRRAAILDSFAHGKLPPICRECSGYTPDTVFACPYFKGVRPHQPLPLDFFHNMVT